MRGRKMRWIVVALVAVSVAFVAVGGPATAKRFIDGGDIAPGTVGKRQLAKGAVTLRKISRRARRALRGARGATGPAGPQGPAGAAGARGPAGAFRFVDRNGTVVGDAFGYFSGIYPEVMTSAGVVIVWDNDATNANAASIVPGVLYYQQLACAGTAYMTTGGAFPLEFGVILESPAVPGSTVYKGVGSPQTFTYASYRTAAGCTTASASISNAYEAQAATTVPAVIKPLHQVPVG
jgi:hypothetical protein